MAPNCTLKANPKRPISQATKSDIRPYKLINKKGLGWQALQKGLKANANKRESQPPPLPIPSIVSPYMLYTIRDRYPQRLMQSQPYPR